MESWIEDKDFSLKYKSLKQYTELSKDKMLDKLYKFLLELSIPKSSTAESPESKKDDIQD